MSAGRFLAPFSLAASLLWGASAIGAQAEPGASPADAMPPQTQASSFIVKLDSLDPSAAVAQSTCIAAAEPGIPLDLRHTCLRKPLQVRIDRDPQRSMADREFYTMWLLDESGRAVADENHMDGQSASIYVKQQLMVTLRPER